MSEGCIAIHPAAGDEGMRREAGMGLNARDAVDDVDTVHSPSRVQNSPVSMKVKTPGSPPHVTDGSDASDYARNGALASGREKKISETSENPTTAAAAISETTKPPPSSAEPEMSQDNNVLPAKRGLRSLQRSGPTLQEEQSSSNCTSGPASESVPQHEQLEEVEPLDISYICTPATLKVKSLLLSRLTDALPSGLLQVVGSCMWGLQSLGHPPLNFPSILIDCNSQLVFYLD